MNAVAETRHDPAYRAKPLGIELTTRCNSACTHCFARAGWAEEACLAPDLARAICAEGYREGYRQLHLTGGEPLLWPYLMDLLDHVFTLGYQSVFLNSNGMLLTDAVARHLAQYPGLALSVSLQGPETLHDRMRGRGAYRGACRGIAVGLEAGLRLSLFTAIGRTLLPLLPAFVADVYAKFGAIERLTLIQMIAVKEAPLDLCRELLTPEAFLRLIRMVSAFNICGYHIHVLNNPLVNVAAARLGLPMIPRSYPLCRPGKLMVRANGDMTLAHSTGKRFGTYTAGMIGAVLSDNRYAKAVAPDTVDCPTCRFVAHCRENGMPQPPNEALDMVGEPFYCQRALALIDQQRGHRLRQPWDARGFQE